MNKKNFSLMMAGIIVVLVFVAVGGYYLMQSSQPPAEENNISQNNDSGNNIPEKTFTITAQNFSFSPAEIKVNKGDKVKIILNNISGFHDWVVDEFSARTEQFQGPGVKEVEFTADKSGTFEFYCSVGSHRQMGMKGNLIAQ
jgi:plastocyanin